MALREMSEETRRKISEAQKLRAAKRRKKGTRRRSKGTGTVYRRGKLWSVAWTQNGVQQYSHGHLDESTAERVRAEIALNLDAGRASLKKKTTETLAELATPWLARRRGVKATAGKDGEPDVEARAGTHRSGRNDAYRWDSHLKPALGHLLPDDVDVGVLKNLIEDKLAEGLSPATVQLLVRLLSTFYSDLIDDGKAMGNPAKMLPRATRKRLKPTHDPKKTPFLERKEDIGRLFSALYTDRPEIGVAYAISALAGLRPGEVLALKWANVQLKRRMIYVRESVDGPTKDRDSREAPIGANLLSLLARWREANPDAILVCPAKGGAVLNNKSVLKAIRKACKGLGLMVLDPKKRTPRAPTMYEAGRHSFASQWVLSGGSMEKLRVILGHSTGKVTERYAHLRTDLFEDADRERVSVPLLAS